MALAMTAFIVPEVQYKMCLLVMAQHTLITSYSVYYDYSMDESLVFLNWNMISPVKNFQQNLPHMGSRVEMRPDSFVDFVTI